MWDPTDLYQDEYLPLGGVYGMAADEPAEMRAPHEQSTISDLAHVHSELWDKLAVLKDHTYQAQQIGEASQCFLNYSAQPTASIEAIQIWDHFASESATDEIMCTLLCVVNQIAHTLKNPHPDVFSLQLNFMHELLPVFARQLSTLKSRKYWASVMMAKKILNVWRAAMVMEEPILYQLDVCVTGLRKDHEGAILAIKAIGDRERESNFAMNALHHEVREKRDLRKAIKGTYQLKDLKNPNHEHFWLHQAVMRMPSINPAWSKQLKDKQGNGIRSPFWEGTTEDYWSSLVLQDETPPDTSVEDGRLADDRTFCTALANEVEKLQGLAFSLNDKYQYFINNTDGINRAFTKKLTEARDDVAFHAKTVSELMEARLNELHNRLIVLHSAQELLR